MDDRFKTAARHAAALSAHCSNGAQDALSARSQLSLRGASAELITEAEAIRDLLFETARRSSHLQIAIERAGTAADREGFISDLRDRVCSAIDDAVEEQGCGKLLDRDLPDLFRTLDALSETLLDRR